MSFKEGDSDLMAEVVEQGGLDRRHNWNVSLRGSSPIWKPGSGGGGVHDVSEGLIVSERRQ